MSRFDDYDLDITKIKNRFALKPFYADQVMIVEMDKDFKSVIRYFEISPENEDKFNQIRSYLQRNWGRVSIEFSNGSPQQRQALGLLPISRQRVLIWRRTKRNRNVEELKEFGIDNFHFDIAEKTILYMANVNWTNEVIDSTVKIAVRPYEKVVKVMGIGYIIFMLEALILAFSLFWRNT